VVSPEHSSDFDVFGSSFGSFPAPTGAGTGAKAVSAPPPPLLDDFDIFSNPKAAAPTSFQLLAQQREKEASLLSYDQSFDIPFEDPFSNEISAAPTSYAFNANVNERDPFTRKDSDPFATACSDPFAAMDELSAAQRRQKLRAMYNLGEDDRDEDEDDIEDEPQTQDDHKFNRHFRPVEDKRPVMKGGWSYPEYTFSYITK
jgi:hypothetical protein